MGIAKLLGPKLIENNLEKLQSEGTIASKYFSAALIQDDRIDKEFL